MSALILDDDLIVCLDRIKSTCPKMAIDKHNLVEFEQAFLRLNEEDKSILNNLGNIIQALIVENGFALIKGLSFDLNITRLLILGRSFGYIFEDLVQHGAIVEATFPNLGSKLQGNQLRRLFLHTDFAMLKNPPVATIIECQQLDPYEQGGRNGIATAQDIISLYYGTAELDIILNTKMPFAAINFAGEKEIIFDYALKRDENGIAKIRFHPTRIHYAFRTLQIEPSKEQLLVLHHLQKMALSVRQEFSLEVGDILIVNNHSALHDRTTCNLKMNLKGELSSRSSRILFVQEFINAKLAI